VLQRHPFQKVEAGATRGVLLCIALLFSLPFILPIHRPPLPGFDAEWLAAVLLAITVTLAGIAGGGKAPLQWPLPAFVFGLVAVGAAHWMLGRLDYPYAFTNLAIAAIALLASYCVGRWLVMRDLKRTGIAAVCVGLVVGGLYSVVVQCFQLMAVEGLPPALFLEHSRSTTSQPFGNIGQPNQLAAYLAMAVVAAGFLRTARLAPAVSAGIQAVLAAGIAVSGSRMGLLMAVLLAAAPLLYRWSVREWSPVLPRAMALIVLAGYSLGMVLGPLIEAQSFGAASTLQRLSAASYGDRWVMWTDAVRVTATEPLIGVGVGQYAAAQYWIAPAREHLLGTPYPHNAVLQFAAEFGIALALAFVALTLWWLAANIRNRAREPSEFAAWLMIVLIGLHAMLEWSLWVVFFYVPAALLWGIAEPGLRRGTLALNTRKVLLPVGVSGLLYSPLMAVDYQHLVDSEQLLVRELRQHGSVGGDVVENLRMVSQQIYFKPQADRLLLRADPPVMKPVTEEDVQRTWRVLSRLPEHRTIAVYISALALNGRVSDSLPHVERMRAFAVTPERYRVAEDIVMKAVRNEGEAAEPLRRELARWR
jgi:O-antigen ligase